MRFYKKLNLKKTIIWSLLSVLMITSFAFITSEFYLRHVFRSDSERDIDIWRAVLYSDFVIRRPNAKFAFRFYGIDAEPLIAANIQLNNLGLISKHDFKKEKEPGEFRIVVLGGEQTASTVANISWPDALEDELNQRFSGKKFRVLNFGWPDAGPEHYKEYWLKEAVQYSPDLVIVNSPETDFYRTAQGAITAQGNKLTFRGKDLKFSQVYKIPIDGTLFLMMVAVTKDNKAPLGLENVNVIASRPYGIFPYETTSPIEVISDRPRIKKLLTKLVQDQITGAMPTFGSFTLDMLQHSEQKLSAKVSQLRNFDTPVTANAQEEIYTVESGVKNFGWLQHNIPNMLLIHTFHAGEMASDFHLSQKMSELDPTIRVVDMRSYVPKNTSKEELDSWYMIPHMGEKFSDKGHISYAKMVADMLCDKHKLPVEECSVN